MFVISLVPFYSRNLLVTLVNEKLHLLLVREEDQAVKGLGTVMSTVLVYQGRA